MTSDQTQDQSPEPNVTLGVEPVSPPYFAYVGINEAARLVGKGKQQIYRDIEAGKLSWHIGEGGKKSLQIADLDRVYKLKSQAVTGNKAGNENRVLPQEKPGVTTPDPLETAVELAVLKAELKAKEDALRRVEEEVRDLRQNRDRLLDQNNRLTMLLTAPKPAEQPIEAPKDEPIPVPQPWYKRIFK